MDHATEPQHPTRPEPPGLHVTLVSGLRPDARTRVCRRLAGTAAGAGPEPSGTAVADDTQDSGDFALVLADRLLAMARDGSSGRTIVGLEPEADLMEVAFVLETELDHHRDEGPVVELHDLVAVVSVRDLHRWLLSPAAGPAEDHVTAEFLASQVEFATVVVLTDATTAPADQLDSVLWLLRRLNPDAAVMGMPAGPLRAARWSGRGCARRLGQRRGWTRALAGADAGDALVFRDPRPFHPERLFEAVRHDLVPHRVGRIARSRGLVQLATRTAQYGSWRSAGDTVSFDPSGISSWDPDAPVGQELVLFGERLHRDHVVTALQACLLTDEELLAGPPAWAGYADPFPVWPVPHHH